MFISNILSTFFILAYSIPRPQRPTTDYYQSPNGELCLLIHHDLPKGGEFLRLYVYYTLSFVDENIPRLQRQTTHYLKRVRFCNKNFYFSDKNHTIREGNLNIYLGWDVTEYEVMSSAHYEFKQKLDSTVQEIITQDEMFSISVTLSHTGEFIYMSPHTTEESGIELQSTLVHDSRELCVKVDNNKYTVLRPVFIGQSPTRQISKINVRTETDGKVFEKKYHAYACGSDNIPIQSDFKFVFENNQPSVVKFYAVSRQHTYRRNLRYYETRESQYEFTLNGVSSELLNQHTELSHSDTKMFLFTCNFNRIYCNGWDKNIHLTTSDSDKNLFASIDGREEISSTASRFHLFPVNSLNGCML